MVSVTRAFGNERSGACCVKRNMSRRNVYCPFQGPPKEEKKSPISLKFARQSLDKVSITRHLHIFLSTAKTERAL